MTLDDYVFEFDPDRMPPIQQTKAASVVETEDAAVLFEWPAVLVGVTIDLLWDMMPTDQYQQLNNLYQAGGTYTFNPDIGLGTTRYSVEILYFYGAYEKTILSEFDYRRNAKLTLMITALL